MSAYLMFGMTADGGRMTWSVWAEDGVTLLEGGYVGQG